MPVRALGQPATDQLGLVRRVIVDHEVDGKAIRHVRLDLVEEGVG